MRRTSRWLLAALLGLASVIAPAPASARPKVAWKTVEAPSGDNHDRMVRALRTALTNAARKADFGKAKSVVLSARVVEFTSVTHGDVHRVSCSIVGRVVGGATARSKISFGGKPEERAKLEQQILTMVANGVVTRLAEIVRNSAAKADKQDE
jgi:hypothetical protein